MPLDASFKQHGVPKEFDEECPLDDSVRVTRNYMRDMWSKVDHPSYVNIGIAKNDFDDHRRIYADPVHKDNSGGPTVITEIIPISMDAKTKPWPDHTLCNEDNWAKNNILIDMTEFLDGLNLAEAGSTHKDVEDNKVVQTPDEVE